MSGHSSRVRPYPGSLSEPDRGAESPSVPVAFNSPGFLKDRAVGEGRPRTGPGPAGGAREGPATGPPSRPRRLVMDCRKNRRTGPTRPTIPFCAPRVKRGRGSGRGPKSARRGPTWLNPAARRNHNGAPPSSLRGPTPPGPGVPRRWVHCDSSESHFGSLYGCRCPGRPASWLSSSLRAYRGPGAQGPGPLGGLVGLLRGSPALAPPPPRPPEPGAPARAREGRLVSVAGLGLGASARS